VLYLVLTTAVPDQLALGAAEQIVLCGVFALFVAATAGALVGAAPAQQQ